MSEPIPSEARRKPHMSYVTDHINCNASGSVCVDGVPITAVAAQYGTPTYIYSEAAIIEAATDLVTAFKTHHTEGDTTFHYSLKANANFTIVKALLKLGVGIDCVSAGEIFKALAAGCPPEHIVYAGVGKDAESIDFAVERGVGWFNVENEHEMDHISAAAVKHGKQVRVCLRVNPDVKAHTNENIATGHKDTKFGIPMSVARKIYANKGGYANVTPSGIHIHIGSQLESINETVTAIKIVVAICDEFGLTHLNIGGGFPISYGAPGEKLMPSVEEFARAIGPVVGKRHLMLEPGRSIVGHSALIVTKALYTKRSDGGSKRFLIVDASMTELMRPALYGKGNPKLHGIVPAEAEPAGAATERYAVVGPVCETTDTLGEIDTAIADEDLVGKYFAILSTGAYGYCMANTYNARPLPPQVIVRAEGGELFCSTKRSTFADLIRDELDQ